MSEVKEDKLYPRVQETIQVMLHESQKLNATYRNEVIRSAITLGSVLAPQLHDSRLHGESNAASVAIRCCCVALFWMKLEAGHEEAAAKVEELRAYLVSPRIR